MENTIDTLFRQYAQQRTQSLRNALVEAHLHVASIVARRFSGRGVDYDDLYQVAALALVKAVERYDPDRGLKFATFATPTVVGEVKNFFRDRTHMISLPRKGTELLRRIESVRAGLEQDLCRAPTPGELAEALGASLEDVLEALEMKGAFYPSSLDATSDEDVDISPLKAFLGVEESGFQHFENAQQLQHALAQLSEIEREVIMRRYFENLSQRDVAQMLGVSQMTVSRTERRALAAIKNILTD